MSKQPAAPAAVPRSDSHVSTRAPFRFTRRENDGRLQRTTDLAELIGSDDLSGECWLFVGPHDDDLCIGGGLLMQAALEAGVDLQAVIVTDGRQGYCRKSHERSIVALRRDETLRSFALLGIASERVANLGFPDGNLTEFLGRRKPREGETPLAGYVGLQNSFTHILRKLRPARVFVPSPADLHPDHRFTHGELMISLFHAAGAIWPELGPPLIDVPQVYELAVYCDFSEPPSIEIVSNADHFQKKLESVAAFQSQVQIAALVESLNKGGPYEYVREVAFRFYCPETYKALFHE